MRDAALHRITESGNFEWPWAAPTGLAIITGAAGGGGGGGGAFCLEGLNVFGAGGDGGGGGGLNEGHPVNGIDGKGCHYGGGGDGGAGAVAPPAEGRLVSNGGTGGKGFPGETLLVELQGLSKGDELKLEVGRGGGGGGGGEGYGTGSTGAIGADGFVVFVPLHVDSERGPC